MRQFILLMALLVLLMSATSMFAQQRNGSGLHDSDIILVVHDGKITTAGVIDDGTVLSVVFSGAFGDSGCQPFTANPGFDSVAGTFVSGTWLVFEATDGLRRWDGDSESFVLVEPDGETLLVSFASLNFTITHEPAGSIGLPVQSNGSFHRHLDFCMNGCPNGCTPPPAAEPGVYLIQWQVSTQDDSLEPTDPFWLLLDYMADEQEFLDALTWAEENLPPDAGTPCPGDANGDGVVDVSDLLLVIANWGASGADVPGDVNGDGVVNVSDLLLVIANWAESCSP